MDQLSSQQPRGLLKNNQDLTIFSPKAGPMKDPRHVAPRIGALWKMDKNGMVL